MHLSPNTVIRFSLLVFLITFCAVGFAQQLQYSRQNVFVQNPEDVQVVANIAGMHHLICITRDEEATVFLFNDQLRLERKFSTPFKIPDKASVKIIPFPGHYFLYIFSRKDKQHSLWKIGTSGNTEDFTVALNKVLESHQEYLESGFQLMNERDVLQLWYHTYISNLQKTVLTVVLLDSMVTAANTLKAMYDLGENGERVLQETFLPDKSLLVLKSVHNGTALQMMKIDAATGKAWNREFFSSGYFFRQPAFAFDAKDSTVTVSALLVEPTSRYNQKQYVFVSRLDAKLVEHVPFKLFKNQFRRNTGTNFMLINPAMGWMRFSTIRPVAPGLISENGMFVDNNQIPGEEEMKGVRFSKLNTSLDIANDSLIKNNRNAYTLKPASFATLGAKGKNFLVLPQEFFNKRNGLLMVSEGEQGRLVQRYLPVQDRYKYLVHRAATIPRQALIIPYLDKQGAGLLRIKFD